MTAIVVNTSANLDQLDSTAIIGITNSNVANSTIDGITFTARTLATNTSWTGLAANKKIAVAIASGNRTTNTSADGITWTAQSNALPSTASWSAVAWGEDVGLFVSISSSSSAAASSSDGITWASRTMPSSQNWLDVAYGNGKFIATSGSSSVKFAYSTDGTNWAACTDLSTAGDWRSICWGDTGGYGTWVAISYNSANIAYSTDNGLTWNVSANLTSVANWRSITYGNGKFVAIAFGSSKVAWSTDGINWTESILPNSLNWVSIAYNEGLKLFVAYAQGSTSGCATSSDGNIWITRSIVSSTWIKIFASPFKWASGDTLTINNGSVLTVNTNQSKFLKTITINDGKLRITNSSTTTPIVFAMGRNTGATSNSIIPTNGLGSIEILGEWIQIGVSDGTPSQTFDSLYNGHHVPAVWVETSPGSNEYEIWLNVTGGQGDCLDYPFDNFRQLGNTLRGKFFIQLDGVLSSALTLTNGSSTTTRYITVDNTSGVLTGASITGTGIAAGSIVDEVVNSTTLRLNLVTTASVGPNSYTVFNPYNDQFSSTIKFGDGLMGKIPENGVKIKIPNIGITDYTPTNLMTSDRTLSSQFVMSGGGNITADKCFFIETYVNATQPQICQFTNCAFSIAPLFSETYNLLINNVGLSIQPDRRYFTTAWITRITRFGNPSTWSYISNASITNLSIIVSQPLAYVGSAANSGILSISNTQNANFNNIKLYSQQPIKSSQFGLYLDTVISSNFSNLEIYGGGCIYAIRSNNNMFDQIKTADTMFNHTMNFANNTRVGSSSTTGLTFVDGVKRYFKIRTYRDWTDLTQYQESRSYSCTPYLAPDNLHPWQFGVINTGTQFNVPTWTRRDPTPGTVSCELYRSQTPGFITRDRSTRLYSSSSSTTVTMNDSGSYNAVASNNSTTFVAVGNNATIAMSGNGTSNWTSRTSITGNWKAVAWNGTNFAAVGINGNISQTSTGADWTSRTCISGNWQAITAGPSNQFCAVGNNDQYCMTSSDNGVTWSQQACIPGDWAAIAWNGTVYVAVGNNGTRAMTSTNGINWVERTIIDGNWNAIAWNGTYFVAVGDNGTTCARSSDGISWTSQTITNGHWKSIAVLGTLFCAVGDNSNGVVGYVTTSSDGSSWTSRNTYGNELLSSGGWTVGGGWTRSVDDFTHTSGVATISNSATIVSTALYKSSWVITGRTSGSITISVGGLTYSSITDSGEWNIPGVINANKFTITPTSDFDGTISLISLKVRHVFGWSSITCNGTNFVCVGCENLGAVTMTSTDGINWDRSIGINGLTTNGTLVSPSNGSTYYYVLRKYNSRIANPSNNSGKTNEYTVTTDKNFNQISTLSVVNCRGVSGNSIITASGSNFDVLGIKPGMLATGNGVPPNTTVLSIDSYYQITLSNNLTSSINDSTITFGLTPGMYVFGTGIGQNAKLVSIDSDTQITLDVPHESDVSGILYFCSATESAEQSVYTHGASISKTNLCLQSSGFSTVSWVKTNITATADVAISPTDNFFIAGTSLTLNADRLAATANNGTITQDIPTIVGAKYTFSVYLISNNISPQTLASGSISLGTSTETWTVSQKWKRFSTTFTASSSTTTAKITISLNGSAIIAAGAQVELGTSASPPINTTTTAVSLGPVEFNSILGFNKSSSGNTSNQGIQLGYVSSGLWIEFFSSSSGPDFIPNKDNMIGMNIVVSTPKIMLNTSNNNVFKNLSQVGISGVTGSMISLTTSSNNQFLNFVYNLNYGTTSTASLLSLSNLSNNNFLCNWDISGLYNSVSGIYPFGGAAGTTNNNSGLILQNIRLNNYDAPLNNNYSNVICKGVSGGSHSPLSGTATTSLLGSTTDGVALVYTTIYDTIFNELYHGTNDSSLYLTFNASANDIPPYTILSGNPRFSNSGRLYMLANDSIEYTWPHKLFGISGFRTLRYKTSGVDIGTDLTTGFSIKIEISVDTGSGYSSYVEAIPENLKNIVVSKDDGFNLKIKLTALPNMKYTSRTTKFIIGETITGNTSGASAVIVDDENGANGTVGTLRLRDINGIFIPGEIIKSGGTNRASNLATNTSFALGPSFTSYINGLEIYTNTDKTISYPVSRPYIKLTGLNIGSEVRVFRTSDSDEIVGNESVSSSTFLEQYDYYDDVNVYIVIMSLGFKPITFYNQTLGIEGLTIPVQQEIDRNYLNQ